MTEASISITLIPKSASSVAGKIRLTFSLFCRPVVHRGRDVPECLKDWPHTCHADLKVPFEDGQRLVGWEFSVDHGIAYVPNFDGNWWRSHLRANPGEDSFAAPTQAQMSLVWEAILRRAAVVPSECKIDAPITEGRDVRAAASSAEVAKALRASADTLEMLHNREMGQRAARYLEQITNDVCTVEDVTELKFALDRHLRLGSADRVEEVPDHRPSSKGTTARYPSRDLPEPHFHQLVSVVGEHPALLRRLGLLFDVYIDLETVPSEFDVIGRCPTGPQGLVVEFSAPTRCAFSQRDGTLLFGPKPRQDSEWRFSPDGSSILPSCLGTGQIEALPTLRRMVQQHSYHQAEESPAAGQFLSSAINLFPIRQFAAGEIRLSSVLRASRGNWHRGAWHAEDLMRGVVVDVRQNRKGAWLGLCGRRSQHSVRLSEHASDDFTVDDVAAVSLAISHSTQPIEGWLIGPAIPPKDTDTARVQWVTIKEKNGPASRYLFLVATSSGVLLVADGVDSDGPGPIENILLGLARYDSRIMCGFPIELEGAPSLDNAFFWATGARIGMGGNVAAGAAGKVVQSNATDGVLVVERTVLQPLTLEGLRLNKFAVQKGRSYVHLAKGVAANRCGIEDLIDAQLQATGEPVFTVERSSDLRLASDLPVDEPENTGTIKVLLKDHDRHNGVLKFKLADSASGSANDINWSYRDGKSMPPRVVSHLSERPFPEGLLVNAGYLLSLVIDENGLWPTSITEIVSPYRVQFVEYVPQSGVRLRFENGATEVVRVDPISTTVEIWEQGKDAQAVPGMSGDCKERLSHSQLFGEDGLRLFGPLSAKAFWVEVGPPRGDQKEWLARRFVFAAEHDIRTLQGYFIRPDESLDRDYSFRAFTGEQHDLELGRDAKIISNAPDERTPWRRFQLPPANLPCRVLCRGPLILRIEVLNGLLGHVASVDDGHLVLESPFGLLTMTLGPELQSRVSRQCVGTQVNIRFVGSRSGLEATEIRFCVVGSVRGKVFEAPLQPWLNGEVAIKTPPVGAWEYWIGLPSRRATPIAQKKWPVRLFVLEVREKEAETDQIRVRIAQRADGSARSESEAVLFRKGTGYWSIAVWRQIAAMGIPLDCLVQDSLLLPLDKDGFLALPSEALRPCLRNESTLRKTSVAPGWYALFGSRGIGYDANDFSEVPPRSWARSVGWQDSEGFIDIWSGIAIADSNAGGAIEKSTRFLPEQLIVDDTIARWSGQSLAKNQLGRDRGGKPLAGAHTVKVIVPKRSLPRLRFGWSYEFLVRPVYLNGEVPAIPMGALALPFRAQSTGSERDFLNAVDKFQRFEALAPPRLGWGDNPEEAAELFGSFEEVFIYSIGIYENDCPPNWRAKQEKLIGSSCFKDARIHIGVPEVALNVAEFCGCLEAICKDGPSAVAFYETVQRMEKAKGSPARSMDVGKDVLPDPDVGSLVVVYHDGSGKGTYSEPSDGFDHLREWPVASIKHQLSIRRGPLWDDSVNTLDVRLGERVQKGQFWQKIQDDVDESFKDEYVVYMPVHAKFLLEIRSKPNKSSLNHLVWYQLAGQAGLEKKLVEEGRHHLSSPPLVMRMRHVGWRPKRPASFDCEPLARPRFGADQNVDFRAPIAVHSSSTLTCYIQTLLDNSWRDEVGGIPTVPRDQWTRWFTNPVPDKHPERAATYYGQFNGKILHADEFLESKVSLKDQATFPDPEYCAENRSQGERLEVEEVAWTVPIGDRKFHDLYLRPIALSRFEGQCKRVLSRSRAKESENLDSDLFQNPCPGPFSAIEFASWKASRNSLWSHYVVEAIEPPAPPSVRDITPVFQWTEGVRGKHGMGYSTRRNVTWRITLEQPWFSSGGEECLAAVCLPKGQLNQSDVTLSEASRWGVDPAFQSDSSSDLGALQPENFRNALKVASVQARSRDGQGRESLVEVDLAVLVPKFNMQTKSWECDLSLLTHQYTPFVWLRLVRYQRNAIDGCQISRPIELPPLQCFPQRDFSVVVSPKVVPPKKGMLYEVSVSLGGVFPNPASVQSELTCWVEYVDNVAAVADPPDFGWKRLMLGRGQQEVQVTNFSRRDNTSNRSEFECRFEMLLEEEFFEYYENPARPRFYRLLLTEAEVYPSAHSGAGDGTKACRVVFIGEVALKRDLLNPKKSTKSSPKKSV